MEKTLISACLLGECVKYNGSHNKTEHPRIQQLQKDNRLVPICPEVMGGLGTPRPPAEINPDNGCVITKDGSDVTTAFLKGAEATLQVAADHDVKLAILKQNSPSCGSRQIYDGTFQGQRVAGQGLTAKVLRQHGIQVIGEDELD